MADSEHQHSDPPEESAGPDRTTDSYDSNAAETEVRPERIGPYKILDVLGEGGMGTVYLAEQKEPVRRRVALKLIKLGMDSKEVVARFGAEQQALAMMEHDNIAKVFEVGTTERGQGSGSGTSQVGQGEYEDNETSDRTAGGTGSGP